jgi:hypothetical protein
MEIKPFNDKREEVLRLFLLNMNLLTPAQRGIIIKILDSIYGYVPIEEEFVKSSSVDKK